MTKIFSHFFSLCHWPLCLLLATILNIFLCRLLIVNTQSKPQKQQKGEKKIRINGQFYFLTLSVRFLIISRKKWLWGCNNDKDVLKNSLVVCERNKRHICSGEVIWTINLFSIYVTFLRCVWHYFKGRNDEFLELFNSFTWYVSWMTTMRQWKNKKYSIKDDFIVIKKIYMKVRSAFVTRKSLTHQTWRSTTMISQKLKICWENEIVYRNRKKTENF